MTRFAFFTSLAPAQAAESFISIQIRPKSMREDKK